MAVYHRFYLRSIIYFALGAMAAIVANPDMFFPDDLYAEMDNQATANSLARAFAATAAALQQQKQPTTPKQAQAYLAAQAYKPLLKKLKQIHGSHSALMRHVGASRAMQHEHEKQKNCIEAIRENLAYLSAMVAAFEKEQTALTTGRRGDRERVSEEFRPRLARSTERFAPRMPERRYTI